jgi:hypothetical protein
MRRSLKWGLVLLAVVIPISAEAAQYGDFLYETNDVGITITGYKYPPSSVQVSIPNAVDGLPVTEVADSAFASRSDLKEIIIPNSVTHLGDYAFYCTSLTNIAIPDRVIRIGNHAFRRCSQLTNFTIPSSVTQLGDMAFAECTGLTSITIPGGVTNIGADAFGGCSGFTNVTILSGVMNIGEGAFRHCTSLKSVELVGGVTTIGYNAFSGCSQLPLPTSGVQRSPVRSSVALWSFQKG